MESLDQRPPQLAEAEASSDPSQYRVTLLDDLAVDFGRWQRAAFGTAIVHLAVLIWLASVPRDLVDTDTIHERKQQLITRLIDPPTKLTQKAPNLVKPTQEIALGSPPPAPKLIQPEIAPKAQKRFSAPPPAQVAKRTDPSPSLPQDPPKVAPQTQQAAQLTPSVAVAPPPPKAAEPPKLVLESVPPPPSSGKGTGLIKVPSGGVQEAIEALAKTAATSSRAIGDDTDTVAAPSPSLNSSPSPTRPKSKVELVSDPKGVDFRAYLLQVLQDVRRNWFAVMPESAHLGIRGRVVAQFSIAPSGEILKVVLTSESNARQLDRAAVAALSMSNPLPQLPPDFKGDRIVLQFTFLYNAPK